MLQHCWKRTNIMLSIKIMELVTELWTVVKSIRYLNVCLLFIVDFVALVL